MSTRAERRAERRKQKGQPGAAQRSVPWFTLLVVAVLLVGGYFVLKELGAFAAVPTPPSSAPVDPSQVKLNVGQKVPVMDATHIPVSESFTAYNSTPPSSGPHWNAQGSGPIAWSAYASQQRNEGIVHNLEHGGVLVAYDPSLSAEDVAKLRSIRSRWPKDRRGLVKIIIEPYAGLGQGTISMTAWGYIDTMTAFDQQRIEGFIAAHINQGPEDAP